MNAWCRLKPSLLSSQPRQPVQHEVQVPATSLLLHHQELVAVTGQAVVRDRQSPSERVALVEEHARDTQPNLGRRRHVHGENALAGSVEDLPAVARSVPCLRRTGTRSRSRCSGVVIEQPTETLVSTHSTDTPCCRLAVNEFVVQSLMIPLAMVVGDKFRDSPSMMALTTGNQAVQTFLFDRADEPFGVGVGIGCPIWCPDDANPGVLQARPHRRIHLASRSQVSTRHPSASASVRFRTIWHMNVSSGCGVEPRIWTRREASSITKTVYNVTKPCQVQTSVVKKSAAAISPQCARRNVCHEVGRSGTGGIPVARRIRAIVDRPTRCPMFLRAPWMRV